VTFVAVVVAAIAPGSALAVATAATTALGDTIFFVKVLDNPTIVGIVGVLLVEDAEAAASTFIMLGAVPAVLFMLGLRREDSSLLTLGVLGLRSLLWTWSLPSPAGARCNIPSFYQIFLDKKIVLFVLCEKSQGFKTF
jgi:hypothetical protein